MDGLMDGWMEGRILKSVFVPLICYEQMTNNNLYFNFYSFTACMIHGDINKHWVNTWHFIYIHISNIYNNDVCGGGLWY